MIYNEFMAMALEEAKKANCAKGKVGAVIVLNDKVLGKGNNSVPNNCQPCTINNCLRKKYGLKSGERQEICRAVHAEQNAILNCLKNGEDISKSTIYVTKSPCMICAKIIINSGISKRTLLFNHRHSITMKAGASIMTHPALFGMLNPQERLRNIPYPACTKNNAANTTKASNGIAHIKKEYILSSTLFTECFIKVTHL